jgi:hypothetical protein
VRAPLRDSQSACVCVGECVSVSVSVCVCVCVCVCACVCVCVCGVTLEGAGVFMNLYKSSCMVCGDEIRFPWRICLRADHKTRACVHVCVVFVDGFRSVLDELQRVDSRLSASSSLCRHFQHPPTHTTYCTHTHNSGSVLHVICGVGKGRRRRQRGGVARWRWGGRWQERSWWCDRWWFRLTFEFGLVVECT